MDNTFTIDRKSASRQLKVSIRTIDRYIRANKLSMEERQGRIWLNKKEIQKLKAKKIVDAIRANQDSEMTIDKEMSTPVDMSMDGDRRESGSDSQIGASKRAQGSEGIYRKLFEELQQDLKVKQERLEGANYRVGQLEGILRDSVPRLDHNRVLLAERAQKEELEVQHLSLKVEYDQIRENLRDEKLTKKVLMGFIFLLIALQFIMLWLSVKQN
jgi:hypothetical protein